MTIHERYQRQVILKELGEAGQQKLSRAKVLVIGAGGLGCPALQYLAAAGVGTIGIADDDVVAISNLHRQVLYTINDIGKKKTECAAKALLALNDTIIIIRHSFRIDNKNALECLKEYDLVIDATDNLSARYMINDACYLLNKPLIYGSIFRFEGQLSVFNFTNNITYRDLFPEQPADADVASCNEAGVIGALCGIIGSMQAAEAIKIICNMGNVAAGKLVCFNMLMNSMYDISIVPNPMTAKYLPDNMELFMQHDYDLPNQCNSFQEIDTSAFDSMRMRKDVCVIDVRELDEQPTISQFNHLNIPMSSFSDGIKLPESTALIVFCQSGKRSRTAAQVLSKQYKEVYSLKDGIAKWLQQKETQDA